MKASKVLVAIVLVDALIMALGHAPLAYGISALFRRPGGQQSRPPPTGQPASGFSFFHAIGAYFLIATILYVLSGILVATGKFSKLANYGLIALAVVDNILLIYTRTMPNIFFGRMLGWSWSLFPPGTVEVLVGQCIIIALCAILLYRPKL